MPSKKFFVKYALQDIHWVGHSVMKPVDAVQFQNIKATIKRINEPIENFEIMIFYENALDKVLVIPLKNQMLSNPGRQHMRLSMKNT